MQSHTHISVDSRIFLWPQGSTVTFDALTFKNRASYI